MTSRTRLRVPSQQKYNPGYGYNNNNTNLTILNVTCYFGRIKLSFTSFMLI